MPERLSGSVVWGLGFYGWVLHCASLRWFTIITCEVAVVVTTMWWQMYLYQNLNSQKDIGHYLN